MQGDGENGARLLALGEQQVGGIAAEIVGGERVCPLLPYLAELREICLLPRA
jgi:hypothetical protein